MLRGLDIAQAQRRTDEGSTDPFAGDSEWEDVPGDFDFADALAAITPEGEALTPAVDASGGVFVASRYVRKANPRVALIARSIPSRTRIDARSRAEQIQSQEHAWKALLPELVDAFLGWKHREALSRDSEAGEPPRAGTAPSSAGGEWFTVAAICDTGTSL